MLSQKKTRLGYTLIGTDLTEYKEAEQAIQLHAEKLQESNEALERFAFIASHDLKEPVRTANGFIGLLERKLKNNTDPDVKDYLTFVKESNQRMYQLIDASLTMSLINSQQEMEPSVLNGDRLLARVTGNLNELINQRRASIIYNNIPNIFADEAQIELLFQNLIENGIKYNESTHPVIKVDCSTDGAYHVFSFHDNGIGIEKAYQQQIFQMFKRLHNREKYKGTGIGLAICKRIVEKHKGEIWVESAEGQGTTFRFTLPNRNMN
ncbi:MAG: ATP-binding protein [Bacteroidota bacterium]